MRHLITTIALLSAGWFSAQAQPDTWTQLDDVNGAPKSACIGFELNGEGYIGLGLDEMFERTQLYSYDVGADDWDNEEDLGNNQGQGLERCAAVSFSIGGLAYAGLGSSTGDPYFIDFWEYDPNTNAWTQMANFGGTARRQAVGFAINGKGYVGTGVDENGDYRKDFWEYDPLLNTWTQLNDFGGTARQSAVGFAMGNKGYVGTGDDGVPRKDFWEYDPVSDSWTQKPDLPGAARAGAVGFGIYPQAFIATGYSIDFEYTSDLWEFNIDSNYWVQRSDFPGIPRAKGVSFVINDIAYFGTGYSDDYLDDFWSYTPPHICITDTTSETVEACDNGSYQWANGNGNTYTSADGNGPWYHTMSSVEFPQCDSVVELYINWNAPSNGLVNDNACENTGYSWIDGNTYVPADGTGPWYHTIIGGSSTGCDSTVELNLTWNTINDLTVSNNGTTLTSNASGSNTYQWVDCDNGYSIISGATGQSYSPTTTGNYAVIITGSLCQDTSDCESFISTLNLDEISFESLNVFPNPTTGNVHIDLGNSYENVKLEIKNVLGQVVRIDHYSLAHHIEFNLQGASGLYFIELKTDDGKTQTVKLLKE